MIYRERFILAPCKAHPYPRPVIRTWVLIAGTTTWILVAMESDEG